MLYNCPFTDFSFAPIDRPFSLVKDQITEYLVTLGTCSYVSSFIMTIWNDEERPNHILVGRFSSIADNVSVFIGHQHSYKNIVTTFPFAKSTVEKMALQANIPSPDVSLKGKNVNKYQVMIGSDVWIGRGATLIGGVKIGSGAIIGTNAMVAKDIPPYAIAVGNPAKVIKYRFDEETRKKFMAVKWWNWDLKKICQNISLMNNPEKFLEKNYSPELENIPQDNLGGGVSIKNLRATGRKIYSFVGDFSAPQPLWKRVLDGFFKSTSAGDILVFWVDEGSVNEKIDELNNFLNGRELTDGKIIFGFTPKDGKIFSPYILRNSTHFITTREMISLECMDWLWDTDVKIVSALDDGIFDGEPEVNWGEIIGK